MKRFTTIVCCIAFMISGIFMAVKSIGDKSLGQNAAMAATSYFSSNLPLDLQLDLEKRLKKNEKIIHDTIHDSIPIKCNHKKHVRYLKPDRVTDTLYLPMPMPRPMESMPVLNKIQGDREEYTPGELFIGSKPSSVTLTVDGQVVYKSETDIHSTEDRQ